MASKHAEIKAGTFIAFSLALLFAMVFAVGDCGKYLRGSQECSVLFSSVTGLQPSSAVNYAGVEIGQVRETRIVIVDHKLLQRMPVITVDILDRLPLTFSEREQLKLLKDPMLVDQEVRRLIGPRKPTADQPDRPGRKMIMLVLEVLQDRQNLGFRVDDVVRLATTVMGDSTVEISPGSGRVLKDHQVLLGDGSNLFSQVSDSMREIRNLLARVSDTIGQEERANIQVIIGNARKASDNLVLASDRLKTMVINTENPIAAAARDLQAGMGEARKAVASARTTIESIDKTVETVKPKVVSALTSGKAMMESGQKAAQSAERLMDAARPKVVSALEEMASASRKAGLALAEMQSLLVGTGDGLDENRPAIRRALLDFRESARNFKDLSSRVKRQPWLLMKRASVKEQELVVLESASRELASATAELAITSEFLNSVANNPKAVSRLGAERAGELIKAIEKIHQELQKRNTKSEQKLHKLDRKSGGRLLEKARQRADQEK